MLLEQISSCNPKYRSQSGEGVGTSVRIEGVVMLLHMTEKGEVELMGGDHKQRDFRPTERDMKGRAIHRRNGSNRNQQLAFSRRAPAEAEVASL